MRNLGIKAHLIFRSEWPVPVGDGPDKNTIQRIESGQRLVPDIELIVIAKAFDVNVEELVQNEE